MIDYIYLRVSTDDKNQNPENQLSDCKQIAPEGAIIVIEQSSGWKDDLTKRPEFARIVKEIKEGKVRSFITWDIDRLWRKRLKIVEFMYMCAAKGVINRSFRQQFLNDFDNILDNFPKDNSMYWMIEDMVKDMKDRMIKIFGWIAEEESNKKSDRVKAAVRKKDGRTFSHNGKRWGRKSLPKQTINRVLELRFSTDPPMSVRKIAEIVKTTDKNNNQKNISKSVVHKILAEFSPEKPSNFDMSTNRTIKGQLGEVGNGN